MKCSMIPGDFLLKANIYDSTLLNCDRREWIHSTLRIKRSYFGENKVRRVLAQSQEWYAKDLTQYLLLSSSGGNDYL